MGAKKVEKNLGAMMDGGLVDAFTRQVDERSSKNKRSLAAAVKLWVSLPRETQSGLLDQSLEGSSLIALVRQIADERIEAGRKAGKAIVSRQKRSKPRKD